MLSCVVELSELIWAHVCNSYVYVSRWVLSHLYRGTVYYLVKQKKKSGPETNLGKNTAEKCK